MSRKVVLTQKDGKGCTQKVKVKVCFQTIHVQTADRPSERPAWGPLYGFIQYVTCPSVGYAGNAGS